MHFDFKITTWERVEVHEDDLSKVIDAIKTGKVSTSNELFELEDTKEIKHTPSYKLLDETSESLQPVDNDGAPTLEIMEDGKTLWSNGDELWNSGN